MIRGCGSECIDEVLLLMNVFMTICVFILFIYVVMYVALEVGGLWGRVWE